MSKYKVDMGHFILAPDIITDELGLITSCVYGKIWRYEQMSDDVCRAAIDTLAKDMGVSYNTVLTHIKKLLDAQYLKDLTPGLRNRPHVYKTTGRLKIELGIVLSTPQNLESTPQNLETHSSKFGDESESLIESFNREEDDNESKPKTNPEPEQPVKRPNIFTMYEKGLGTMIVQAQIPDLLETEKEYPADWIEKAFKIAADNNARKWSYVKAVLENMKAHGRDWKPAKYKSKANPTDDNRKSLLPL